MKLNNKEESTQAGRIASSCEHTRRVKLERGERASDVEKACDGLIKRFCETHYAMLTRTWPEDPSKYTITYVFDDDSWIMFDGEVFAGWGDSYLVADKELDDRWQGVF